jgi:hypothetical protein
MNTFLIIGISYTGYKKMTCHFLNFSILEDPFCMVYIYICIYRADTLR